MVDTGEAAFLALSHAEQRRVVAMMYDWAGESYEQGYERMAAFASALHSQFAALSIGSDFAAFTEES